MSDYEKNQFGRLLKYYLELNGKKQIDIINDLGYDKSTVSGWCSGSRVPKLDVIIQVANYLHVNVDDLVIDKPAKSNEESYYLNEDAKDMAQFMFDNPEYKVLFDASRKVKREDIEFVKKMIDKMSE